LEYAPFLLGVVASAWHTALPASEQMANVETLAEAMLAPGALESQVAALSATARQALALMVRAGGTVPSHRITMNYGSIRRFGPARLEREKPWQEPASPLEELYYRGLVYRAYGEVGAYYGEILLIPDPFMEALPRLTALQAQVTAQPIATPEQVRAEDDALVEDLFAVLVYLRLHRLQAPQQGLADTSWLDVQRLGLSRRMLGSAEPARQRLLAHLLTRLRLIQVSRGGWLEPTLRARDWLRQPDAARLDHLLIAWRDDADWDELCHLPTLRCEGTGWRSDPVVARRNLMAFLAAWPAETWFALDDLLGALKEQLPDYLRPDGDFTSWYIRNATTDEYLSGFASWDAVEGALARYLCTGPLHWLGVVRLGHSEGRPVALWLTARSKQLLSGVLSQSRSRAESHGRLATVSDDLRVSIVPQGTLYDRYLLERFAEWQGQGAQANYAITIEALARGVEGGIKLEQMVAFLKRVTQDQIPAVALRALLAWGARFGRVSLQRAVLLRAHDEATLQQIQADPELQPLVREVLTPTTCWVAEEDLAELERRLKAAGLWPHLRA
jgi:hypothetical protein